MKKIQLTGLALATLAACAPAWAQSTVMIYGAVDAAVGKTYQADGIRVQPGKAGLNSSSMVNLQDSFVGFKGVEDLGAGLQVGFQLEQKLDASSGAADIEGAFAHSANLWMGGNWGRIKIGRATTPSYNTMTSWDLTSGGNYSIAYNTFGGVGFSRYKRQSNQISYRTPKLGGFVVEAAYVPKDDNIIGGVNRSRMDFGATYSAGPLIFGAAYNKVSGQDANFAFGAKYKYQNFDFSGGYYQSRNGDHYDSATLLRVPNSIGGNNGFTVGVRSTWNQFSAGVEVARETKSNYAVAGIRFDDKKHTNYSVNGVYSFSKRTQAYVNYVRVLGVNNYGVGLSHSF